MPKKSTHPETANDLRHSAERLVEVREAGVTSPRPEADMHRLRHELEVHQIELEMQNAELRAARDRAEVLLDQYTDLYDFAPVGYFTLARDGTIRLANLTGTCLVGVERSRLIGQGFGHLVAPELRADFKAFLKQVFAGQLKQSADFKLLPKGLTPCIVNIEAQRSPNGRECCAVVMDVTDRKEAEDQVRVSEIRYRRLFEAANDGVILLDPGTRKITDANPFMIRLLGYPREQLVGKELFEIGLLKDESASREMFQMLKRQHEVRYDDLPLESQDGRHQEVEVVANLYDENGRQVIQCNIRDITERKLAEDVLRRNEALFSALIEQAPVGVYVVDAGFRLLQVNPVGVSAFQNVNPLIGRDFSEIVHIIWPKRVADEVVEHFRHTLRTGESYQSPGLTGLRRDIGTREIYEWQIERVTLPAGEHGVVCFFSNITERKKAEIAQRRVDVLAASNLKLKNEVVRRQATEKSLKQSEHEQSRLLLQSRRQEEQLRSMSHEILQAQEHERKRISRELHDVIAQTLVGINVHVAALTQECSGPRVNLQEKITRTQRLVEESLDIVHRFAGELRPTMLDDLGLIPALKTFMQEFIESTGIRASLKAYAGIENMDNTLRTVLYRVAQEALTNVARHANASHVEVRIENPDGVIQMQVIDDGKGFEVARIAGSKRNGRLGLLGMKERVEMIGGKFHVESTPETFTSVRVEFPQSRIGTKKRALRKSPRA